MKNYVCMVDKYNPSGACLTPEGSPVAKGETLSSAIEEAEALCKRLSAGYEAEFGLYWEPTIVFGPEGVFDAHPGRGGRRGERISSLKDWKGNFPAGFTR